VLVLDDLHWADQPSLLLLQFVSRELNNSRLLLVGTYRDMELSRQHPLAESLGELTRERLFQRVLLRGLNQQDVGRFIEVAAGVDPPPGLAEAVYTQTEGNPLFVTEVVRLLVQEGELNQETGPRNSWTVRIPEGVREVIGRRLNRLSQRCNESLTIASVIGREFELTQLAPLVEDASEERLLDVLEEALAARVIEELPQAVGRYQFTHALIQDTLTEELTLTRRVRLHARIAETLEELYGDNVETHAAELAHHFAQAGSLLGSEKVVHYSLAAGERALATYAWEEALVHFHQGLEAKGDLPADPENAALLFGLARAHAGTSERHQATSGQGEVFGNLLRAFEHYAEIGDVAHAVQVATFPLPPLSGVRGGSSKLLTRALTLVPPDSRQAGQLHALYGRVVALEEGNYSDAEAAFNRALIIADHEEDERLKMRVLIFATRVSYFHLRFGDGLAKGLESVELVRRLDDPLAGQTAHYWTGQILRHTGDLVGARHHAEQELAYAKKLNDRFHLASALWSNELVHRLQGDLRAAIDFNDQGIAISPRDVRLAATRVLLDCETGELLLFKEHLDNFLNAVRLLPPGPTIDYGFVPMIVGTILRTTNRGDQLQIALEAADAVLLSDSATPAVVMQARIGLGLLAAEGCEGVVAKELYSGLKSVAGFAIREIVVDRVLGLLAATLGNLHQSTAHFEDALAFCRKAGYRPELAWTCCDYADMLKERDADCDRAKAISLLDESLAISSELGMRPLMERVLSRREILKA
jgi:tetratricopeptide (TPR) repeat protein